MERASTDSQDLGSALPVRRHMRQGLPDELLFHDMQGHSERDSNASLGLVSSEDRGREMNGPDHALVDRDDQPLDQILKLSNVSRPGVLLQRLDRCRRQDLLVAPVFRAERPKEHRGDEREIFWPVTQGRKGDRDHRETVVQVLAKGSSLHRVFEVLVGGGNESDVDGDRVSSAQPSNLAVLEHTEKIDLHLGGRVVIAPVKAPRS